MFEWVVMKKVIIIAAQKKAIQAEGQEGGERGKETSSPGEG